MNGENRTLVTIELVEFEHNQFKFKTLGKLLIHLEEFTKKFLNLAKKRQKDINM